MFKELHNYIKESGMVTIYAVPEGDDKIRLSIQAKVPEGKNASVFTPLVIVGTPDELDAELNSAIGNFMEGRVSIKEALENSLAIMKADAEKVAKDAKDAAALKASQSKNKVTAKPSTEKTADKVESKPSVPDLFSMPMETEGGGAAVTGDVGNGGNNGVEDELDLHGENE